MHILTHGADTYTSDSRYQARHDKRSDTWELVITDVQMSDRGVFECQLSSMPVISWAVQLTVVNIWVDILGDDLLYVQTDSSLVLTCIVTNITRPRLAIVWTQNGQQVSPSPYLSIGTVVEDGEGGVTSSLSIKRVQPQSAGLYQCGWSGSEKGHLQLHVLSGDRRQQLQTSMGHKNIKFILSFQVIVFLFGIKTI